MTEKNAIARLIDDRMAKKGLLLPDDQAFMAKWKTLWDLLTTQCWHPETGALLEAPTLTLTQGDGCWVLRLSVASVQASYTMQVHTFEEGILSFMHAIEHGELRPVYYRSKGEGRVRMPREPSERKGTRRR